MYQVKDGHLFFDGCDTTQLAAEFGTPVYIMSETGMVNKIQELKNAFVKPYPGNRIAYAAKAFFPLAMAQLVKREGICVDVVSGGELYTAIKGGIPPENIEFNGNNKSRNELEMAVEYGIGRVIVDGLQELELLEAVCQEQGKTMDILFRVTPGVKSDSHDYIVTGKKDSKFGIPLDEHLFYPYVEQALASQWVNLVGLHFHVGSQLLDTRSHMEALDILLELVDQVKRRFNHDFSELNVGGGFGIRYTDETPPPFSAFVDPMMKKITAYYASRGLALPAVVVEPGRSIVGESGITLYAVGSIKEIPDLRTYVSVDGGMGDNIRPALYQASYHGVVANKADQPATQTVAVSGKYCESGDILIPEISLPTVETGDILAVFSTGAYGHSMAMGYNRNPLPGVVLTHQGKADWIVRPESYHDLFIRDKGLTERKEEDK